MAKLIRCPAGHIYDREAHEACPECARTGVPKAAEDARPAQVSKAAQGGEGDRGKEGDTGKRRIPLTWLIGGGAAAILLIAGAVFLLRPSGAPVQQADPNSDPDFQACMKPSDVQAEACERAIASGKFSGNALSNLYNNRGIGHQKKNEFDAAISDFAEAIKHNGRNAFAFNNRGNTYRYQNKDDSALEDFAKAIEIDAKYISPYNNRGLYYLDKGEVDRAIADFDQVLRLDANYLRTYWNRGSAYLKKGERDRAIADYKKALSLNPDDSVRKTIEAELNQATALPPQQAAASNQTPASTPGPSTQTSTADPKSDADYGACEKTAGDSSISACDRAIASGKFAGADLGALYRYRGYAKSNAEKPDLDAAIADYGEAVRLEPNSFVPFVLRAIAYAGKGEPELAIKDYDRTIELNPRADFYNNRGNALRKTRAFDRAIADLDQAIKLEPNYSSAYWTRGLIYRDKGDKGKAADDYKKALSLNPSEDAKKEIDALLKEVTEPASQTATPTQATPPQQAGAASTDTSKGEESEPAPNSKVLKSVEQVVADPDYKACEALGSHKLADCDRAIASGKFEGAALAVLYNNRSNARSRNHDNDGALQDLEKAIEINPNSAPAHSNRGVIYANRKEYDRAIADFDKAIEIDATKPFPFQGRGLSYWKKGDLEPAAADYKKALTLNPPPQLKEQIERELKEIEAAATSTPGSEPAQKQGDAANDTGKGKEPDPAPNSKVLKSTEEMLADPDFKACRSMGTNQAADCDRAIASGKFEGPPLATLYNNRGQARGMNRDDDAALEDFNKSIELYPNDAAPYNNRGTIFSERGKYDRAIADFDKAVELNTTQPIIFHGRGLAYWRKGELERAAQDYKKALSLNPPGKLKEIYEQELKEIEAGAKPTPGPEPAQKQGSGATPPDDKNSALSAVREGGTGNASGLPSATEPGSTSQASADQTNDGTKAQLPKSGPWAAIATDEKGGWGSAVGQPSREAAENAALEGCGSGCKVIGDRALKGSCLAYAESRQGGYWYFAWIGPNESNVQSNALNGCNKAAPAGSCKILKSICAPVPGSVPQASADSKKDAESCMGEIQLEAIPACDRAIASGTFGVLDLAALHGRRGGRHAAGGNADAAIGDLSEAIRLNPSNASYFGNRAVMYNARNEYDKAIADLDKAIQLAPTDSSYHQNRGFAYLKKGDKMQAQLNYNLALKLWPDAEHKKQIEQALKEIETGEKSTSGSAPAQKQASQASADPQKDAESCINTFGRDTIPACDRAIASGKFGNLDLGTLHNKRGVVHYHYKETEAAIADLSEAIRLDGSNADYFSNRGNVYSVEGDYDKAIDDLNQAVRLAPDLFKSYENRAEVFLKKGLPGPARDDLNKALSLNPNAKSKKEIEKTLKKLGPDPRKMKMQ